MRVDRAHAHASGRCAAHDWGPSHRGRRKGKSCGPYSFGLYSQGPYSYGLYSYGTRKRDSARRAHTTIIGSPHHYYRQPTPVLQAVHTAITGSPHHYYRQPTPLLQAAHTAITGSPHHYYRVAIGHIGMILFSFVFCRRRC